MSKLNGQGKIWHDTGHMHMHQRLCSIYSCTYKTPFTQYNLLSNRLSNTVWQPVGQQVVSCIQTSNRLSNPLATRWMFVYTMQPVVQPIVEPVWQPVVSCKLGITGSMWYGVLFT